MYGEGKGLFLATVIQDLCGSGHEYLAMWIVSHQTSLQCDLKLSSLVFTVGQLIVQI